MRTSCKHEDETFTHGEILRQANAEDVLVMEARHQGPWLLAPHAHEQVTVNLVLEGHFIENIEGTTFECGDLSVLFRPACSQHYNRYPEVGVRTLILGLAPARLDTLDPSGRLSADGPFSIRGVAAVQALQVYKALREGDPTLTYSVDELILRLDRRGHRSELRRPHPLPTWLARARDTLHAVKPSEPLPRLSALAAEAGVNPSYFARLFRRAFGCSVGEYLRRLRIEGAIARMRSGETSLAAIALDSGFCDQSHFHRCFKRETGRAPSTLLKILAETSKAGPRRDGGEAQ